MEISFFSAIGDFSTLALNIIWPIIFLMNHMHFAHMQHEWLEEISRIAASPKSSAEKIEAVKLLASRINGLVKESGENIIIDDLTGFVSQPFIGQFLEKRYLEADHFSEDISVLILSLKDFEVYQESFGDLEAATVILEVAKIIESSIRDDDIACRYGSDKFFVILPEVDSSQAARLGEIIKQKVEGHIFGQNNQISLGYGLASKSQGADSSEKLLEDALTNLVAKI